MSYCKYTLRDEGQMGFKDLTYKTTCKRSVDYDCFLAYKFCPYCGKEIKITGRK
jgi:rRNA maturation endonuclease Nob1